MAVRHLFDTSPHSTARSRVILGVSRGFAGPPAHLLGMSSETVYHTDSDPALTGTSPSFEILGAVSTQRLPVFAP